MPIAIVKFILKGNVMENNLFISYDLCAPGENYDRVISTIKSFGNWASIHKSLWYIKSNHSANSVADKIWASMDRNDTLIVIDTTNKNAVWHNLSNEVARYIQNQWLK